MLWTSNEPQRKAGTVVAQFGSLHRVRIDNGPLQRIDSATQYPPGSRVLVLGGAILGPAGPAPETRHFQE